MCVVRRGEPEEQDQHTSTESWTAPLTPEDDKDEMPDPSRSHTPHSGPPTPHSGPPTPLHFNIPKIIEPPVPNPSPEPSLFGYGYGYPYAAPPPRKGSYESYRQGMLSSNRPTSPPSKQGSYESYRRARQAGVDPSSPPSSPPQPHPPKRTLAPQASLGAGLDIRACVLALEEVALQNETPYSPESQKRMWHLAALGIGVRKVGDNFGFSSTGCSRSVTPVGWPQGGITGHGSDDCMQITDPSVFKNMTEWLAFFAWVNIDTLLISGYGNLYEVSEKDLRPSLLI
ncbi:hypothetical protein K458DRAFT_391630 [Lentithecium fluviatile CBS 122367]|uniref:Uncharacterized protein n=1 Tax=Lentithecium fluviatile CBS 122367 TaxID=1168545 RepID=A0A6G1IUX0_9PLEO|nr:hypothetical protein K458DRAFT_391630 [Lentithecium fluviatile CBS 122367]